MSAQESWPVTTHDWSTTVDLEHLAHVRRHASRYGAGGRRHQLLEVLAYAQDEAEALGREGVAVVTTHHDGTVTVADDGRGTDTRQDRDGRPVRKPVMATPDLRFFDAPDPSMLPDGLPRRGMSVVAALSPLLVHDNHRLDGAWSQTYRYGVPDADLRPLRPSGRTGTAVTFRTDPALAGPPDLDDSDLCALPWLRVELRNGADRP